MDILYNILKIRFQPVLIYEYEHWAGRQKCEGVLKKSEEAYFCLDFFGYFLGQCQKVSKANNNNRSLKNNFLTIQLIKVVSIIDINYKSFKKSVLSLVIFDNVSISTLFSKRFKAKSNCSEPTGYKFPENWVRREFSAIKFRELSGIPFNFSVSSSGSSKTKVFMVIKILI